MPLATPAEYADMIDRAKAGRFAYPAINVSSSQTLNAAIAGFAAAGSDGILQVSTGGGRYASGDGVADMAVGAAALAAFAEVVAERYPIRIALHTDHCPADQLATFVEPLLAESERRVARGSRPLFHSHMFDGSALPLDENLEIAEGLLSRCAASDVILEVEAGVVGGEEDGVAAAVNESLYTTPADMARVAEVLGTGERGRYLLAATFGNVHGVYQPGAVALRPQLLGEGQAHVGALVGADRPFDLVFHGGSGSSLEDVRATLDHGVVKMNIDTDTQYAFTRPVAGHMFRHYDGVLRVDGDVGDKRAYDPRAWGRDAEANMAARVTDVCEQLRSTGTSPHT